MEKPHGSHVLYNYCAFYFLKEKSQKLVFSFLDKPFQVT